MTKTHQQETKALLLYDNYSPKIMSSKTEANICKLKGFPVNSIILGTQHYNAILSSILDMSQKSHYSQLDVLLGTLGKCGKDCSLMAQSYSVIYCVTVLLP